MEKIATQSVLPYSFYSRKTLLVCRDLLGKILVHRVGGKVLSGRIVETEAYLCTRDPASHACKGPTPRSGVMFGPPGRAYVYFIYGNHFCFNVVAHDGMAGAILVRAVEPLRGIRAMAGRRGISIPDSSSLNELRELANGPGKLCQALGITRMENGADLVSSSLFILDAPSPRERVQRSPRVGIRKAISWPYRFSLKGNPFVSRPRPW